MIDDVLYVIGNGFDIHHGVWSRYSDFANFLKINNYGFSERNIMKVPICGLIRVWKTI